MIAIFGTIKDSLAHNPLFMVGFILLFGYFLGKLFSLVRIPEITGFIVAGVVLNSIAGGLVTAEMNKSLHTITEVAIGLLALTIGSEMSVRKVRNIGKSVLVITVVQFVFTFTAVTGALYMFNMGLPYAVILGVTACATAPAIIVAEVHHLRAHGKFVDYLFGSVVLIDAFCVIIFGVTFTLVTNHLNITGEVTNVLRNSIHDIFFSLLIGAVSGGLMHLLTFRNHNENETQIITLGIIFVTTGISLVFHFSPLLVNIMAGSIVASLSVKNHRLIKALEPLTPPIYAMFFIIAGLELSLSVFAQAGVLLYSFVYFVSRCAGKYSGVYFGCLAVKMSRVIRNNLGFCMASQAGVALGFVLLIQTSPLLSQLNPESAEYIMFMKMMNIVLISIFVNELIGPVLSRYGIVRGNEMEEA